VYDASEILDSLGIRYELVGTAPWLFIDVKTPWGATEQSLVFLNKRPASLRAFLDSTVARTVVYGGLPALAPGAASIQGPCLGAGRQSKTGHHEDSSLHEP